MAIHFVNCVTRFVPLAEIPCFVFGLKIGKLVELANHRVCVLRWLQISDCSVIWTGLEALELGNDNFLLCDLLGNHRILQMESEKKQKSPDVHSHARFCIVDLMPTRCHQLCLRGGH